MPLRVHRDRIMLRPKSLIVKGELGPEKSSNRFSFLHIGDRKKAPLQQAVICLTVTPNRPEL